MKYPPAFLYIITLTVLLAYTGCSHGNGITPDLRNDNLGSANAGLVQPATIPTGGPTVNVGPGSGVAEYPPDEVLIVLQDNIDATSLQPLAQESGLDLMKAIRLSWGTVYRMKITSDENVLDIVKMLKSHSEVRYAEPNYYVFPASVPYYPNDPLFEYDGDPDDSPWTHMYDQWGPNVVGASLTWPTTKGSPDVVVALLDSGVRMTHEDLDNQMWINDDEIPGNNIDDDLNGYIDDWRGWDFDAGDNDPTDEYSHGTACAGVLAAEQDNGVGCTGIAPGIKIMPLRINLTFEGLTTSVVEAVQYAYDNGADMTSMSFRYWEDSDIMHNSFIAAYDNGNGLLPIAAAGNEDNDVLTYPANWPEVFMVGATCSFYPDGKRRDVKRLDGADFGWGSTYGPNLEIMAPGALYITTEFSADDSYLDGPNGTFAGTSNACPVLVGCAALLKSVHPDWSAAQIRNRLNETADDIHTPGRDDQSGFGQVNVWRAIAGSEPNASLYDADGYIQIGQDDESIYDNIFDISTSADYDFEDIFVIEAPQDGVLGIDIDIITTGQDLDLEVYSDPGLQEIVESSTGPNNSDDPYEVAITSCIAGQKYYIKVFSPDEYNCSSYCLRAKGGEVNWWLDYETLNPPYIESVTLGAPMLRLDFTTNLVVPVTGLKVYVDGDIPIGLVNRMMLFEDTDHSGTWDYPGDNLLATTMASDPPSNLFVFAGLGGVVTWFKPLSYIIVIDVGPNNLDNLTSFGVGVRTYQDIGIDADATLVDDPLPVFSDMVIYGADHDPPTWDTTVGLQKTWSGYNKAMLYFNNATDALHEPTSYNVYMDENDPPSVETSQKFGFVQTSTDNDYTYSATITGLENGKKYNFLVRAVDFVGNEDDNLNWLSATPTTIGDPEHPQLLGKLVLTNNAFDVWVYHKIAFIANANGGIAAVDCHDPVAPVLMGSFPALACKSVMYYEPQGLLYAAYKNGLLIIDPDAPGGPALVGTYNTSQAYKVFVDNNICYLSYSDKLALLKVDNPTYPELYSEITVALPTTGIPGLKVKGQYAYCATNGLGFKIVDCSNPWAPQVVKTLALQNTLTDLDIYGDYAFVSQYSYDMVYIVDISNASTAHEVGSVGLGIVNATAVVVRDESYFYFGQNAGIFFSVNWQTPQNPVIKGSLNTAGVNGMFFDGQFLYIVENNKKLKVII